IVCRCSSSIPGNAPRARTPWQALPEPRGRKQITNGDALVAEKEVCRRRRGARPPECGGKDRSVGSPALADTCGIGVGIEPHDGEIRIVLDGAADRVVEGELYSR